MSFLGLTRVKCSRKKHVKGLRSSKTRNSPNFDNKLNKKNKKIDGNTSKDFVTVTDKTLKSTNIPVTYYYSNKNKKATS